MTVHYALADLLEEKGITQAELARRVGKPRSTIGAIVNGDIVSPTLSMAAGIAGALGITLDELHAIMTADDVSEE